MHVTGRAASMCLFREVLSTVVLKNNIISHSERNEKSQGLGAVIIKIHCHPEFISGSCKPVALTNPHPTLSLGEGVMCTLKSGQNFTFSKGEGGTECQMRVLSKISFLTPHSYLIPKKWSFVKLFVNVFTPWRAVA